MFRLTLVHILIYCSFGHLFFSLLVEHFDSSSAIVKAKINALRAQIGQEMAKESKTKSGQATDEKHVSKWMFMNNSSF